MLASGSQDGSIRLWVIDPILNSSTLAIIHNGDATHDQVLNSIDDTPLPIDGLNQLVSKQHVLKVTGEGAV